MKRPYIGNYHSTPMQFFVLTKPNGTPDKAMMYNPTNEHVLSREETKEIIVLLQAYVDEQTVTDNSHSQG